MKKLITFFCFFISLQNAFTQTQIDSLLPKIDAEKDDNIRIDIIYRSLVQVGESNPLLGLKYAQKLLENSKKNKDKIGEAYAMSYMGKMYGVSGNIEKGLEYALRGRRIADQTGNEKLLALSNSMLGLIYVSLSDFSKAISFYMTSVQSAEKANYKEAQVWGFQHLSEIYLAINQVDSALMYAQKDYELSQRIKYFDFISYTLLNLGSIHAKLGNWEVASGYFDMAIQEGYKTKSPKQLNFAFTSKAQYLSGINKPDSAIVYAKKAITVVQNTPFSNYSLKPAKLLLDIYKKNNSDSALKYSEIYRIANDSLFNSKVIQQTQLMSFENEVRQKELAAEKIKAEVQRQQNIQFALIAFGIITFIILFLLFSRSIVANERLISFFGVLGLLIVFEFVNLLIHPWLSSITHESPVLMLLSLVMIASLLIPLHHRLEKWIKEKMTEKNKAIRLAAAKKTIEKLEKTS
jgi:tetratricopeptide (TPR) repeat protein